MTDKTPEQVAAEAKAAKDLEAKQKADKKAADKAAAAAKKAADKTDADAKKAADKAAKQAEAADAKAKKEAEAKAKAEAKAAADAAKEATKMPMQNDVRRPKAGTATGKVWAHADELSKQLGQPVPIANLSKACAADGINDSTIRTQYALWRKFHGVTGRVALPVTNPPAGAAA